MSKHANRPQQDDNRIPLPADLVGADDVVSVAEAYRSGYRDGQRHVKAIVARALLEGGAADLPDDAVRTLEQWAAPPSSLERDQQVGDQRRGEQ